MQVAMLALLVQCSHSCCAGRDTAAGPMHMVHGSRVAMGTAPTFSSMKLRQPSLGTKAAIFLPFLISCTRAHFLMAELGCLASMPLQEQHRGGSALVTSCWRLGPGLTTNTRRVWC